MYNIYKRVFGGIIDKKFNWESDIRDRQYRERAIHHLPFYNWINAPNNSHYFIWLEWAGYDRNFYYKEHPSRWIDYVCDEDKVYTHNHQFNIPNIIYQDIYDGKCKVLLDTSTEHCYAGKIDWNKFFNFTKLDTNHFIHLANDVCWDSETTYEVNKCASTSKNIPTVFYNFWEKYISYEITNDYYNFDFIKNRISDKHHREWKAISFNRRLSPLRIEICKFISETLDCIDYSFGGSVLFKEGDEYTKEADSDIEQAYNSYNEIDNLVDMVSKEFNTCSSVEYKNWIQNNLFKKAHTDINHESNDYASNVRMPIISHTNSYFNIVTETGHCLKNSIIIITEKSYKPIAMFQPFVIVGSPGIIQLLRDDGYDVFDDIIDHSYDFDVDNRINLLKEEIVRLCSISDKEWSQLLFEMLPRLTYNHEHLKKKFNEFVPFHKPLYQGSEINLSEFCCV